MARTPTDIASARAREMNPNVSRTAGVTRVASGVSALTEDSDSNTSTDGSVNNRQAIVDRVTPAEIAKVCHAVNKTLCDFMGDPSQPDWEDAPEWQQESAIKGVLMHLAEDVGPEASHAAWMKEKVDTGWVYGEEKDPEAKTHPCMVPFEELPREQQLKDHLFRAVVHGLK